MKKYSSQYYQLRETILDEYVQPFLNAIQKANLSTKDIVQKSIGRLQLDYAHAMTFDRQSASYLDDIPNASMNEEFKQVLMQNHELLKAYIKLGKYYLSCFNDKETSKKRTIIREFLFDELAPCPEFKPTKIDTSVIVPQVQDMNNFIQASGLPPEIHSHILSFLQDDPETLLNYRIAGKASYTLQKTNQDKLNNIYYAVTKPILITRPHGQYESAGICLRKTIDTQELIDATRVDGDQPLELFKSFHDAVEYAHFLRGCPLDRWDEYITHMPGVMMVSSIGDSSSFQFKDKMLTINKGASCSAYDDNERDIWVSSTTVTAKAVLPISVVALHQYGDFAAYRIFNQHLRLNPKKVTSFSKSKLEKVVHQSFQTLAAKAKDLRERHHPDEGQKLSLFYYELEQQLESLKNNIAQQPNEYQTIIKEFRDSCNASFNTINAALAHHRGINHLLAEAFFTVITFGLYFVAMCINKLFISNKFTLFSTDSVNQLNKAKDTVNIYLDHLDSTLSALTH